MRAWERFISMRWEAQRGASETATILALKRVADVSTPLVRAALGLSFLSAVADRFGFWGAYGQRNVAWGDFSHFVAYTSKLNWFVPSGLIPILAWTATVAETSLALGLLIGLFTRAAALLSGIVLMFFALTMTVALGIKAPLDLSVLSASAGAFLLAAQRNYPFSLDAWWESRTKSTVSSQA
jgi:uncharacterized membrane protein YphA (DoxX/SURF4 family)